MVYMRLKLQPLEGHIPGGLQHSSQSRGPRSQGIDSFCVVVVRSASSIKHPSILRLRRAPPECPGPGPNSENHNFALCCSSLPRGTVFLKRKKQGLNLRKRNSKVVAFPLLQAVSHVSFGNEKGCLHPSSPLHPGLKAIPTAVTANLFAEVHQHHILGHPVGTMDPPSSSSASPTGAC